MKRLILICSLLCAPIFLLAATNGAAVGLVDDFTTRVVLGKLVRTDIVYSATAAAAGTTTTETAITLTKAAGNAATSSAATFVITSGKRFRITSITVGAVGHATATAQSTVFNLRVNTAGAVTTASTPIIASIRVATVATSSVQGAITVPLGDGYEIDGDGTIQIGITAAATYVTNAPTWQVFITGYEY